MSQIRAIERLGIEQYQIPEFMLMQRAGHAALLVLKQCWPHARYITVVCGGGNNGGDGYVLAYLAHQLGLHVVVQTAVPLESLKGAAKQAYQTCEVQGVSIQQFEGELVRADVIVDALLGIGLKGPVRECHSAVIAKMNETVMPVFSLDVPSGLDADKGRCMGETVCADATCTFIGLKSGMMTGIGLACSGKIFHDQLQLPQELFDKISPLGEQRVYDKTKPTYAKRSRNAHKGQFGHVLVIGGAPGFCGAVRMTAQGALRCGAGLVSVATHPSHAAMVNVAYPEIMSHPVEDAKQLKPLLARASVVVLGPGLGQSEWSKKLFKAAITTKLPLIVDADGLNLLAKTSEQHDHWILTPHAGEAARLLAQSSADIDTDRVSAVLAMQKQYGGISLLKGAGTLVVSEQGNVSFCTDGNPGMASGGMGDLLSGVIAGLLANGYDLESAAIQGACLHAQAGDLAAKDGEHGLLASDLLIHLRQLINQQ